MSLHLHLRRLLLLLMCAGAAGAADPLVLNGGFEAGKSPWWGAGEVTRDHAAEGRAALRLGAGFAAQDKRPVVGGQRYRIRLRIRSEAAPAASVYVQLSYRGGGLGPAWHGPARIELGGRSEPALFVTGGDHDWQDFSVVVQAPAAADQLLLYLRKRDKTAGAAYFDAVEVAPTEAPADTAATLHRDTLAERHALPALPPDAAAAALAAAAAPADGKPSPQLTLAQDGRARMRIHVGASPDVVTLGAALRLADYLGRISGGDFLPLSNDASTAAGPLLVVGRDSALTRRLAPDIAYDTLGDDGFVIRRAGRHLVIAGATPRGTMYGVNWLLDRQLGVKWLSPDFTVVPHAPTLRLASADTRQVPRFRYRAVLSAEGEDKPYRAHNLLNGESHGPSFRPSPPEIDSWDRSWMAKGGNASFFNLLPPARYRKAHPDWYAGGQLAMMNPSMREAMAAEIVRRLKALPDYRQIWFDIHDQDWGWDMDPASRAFAAKHGGHASAPRLDMVIDVADRVRRELPGARFAFNAYHWSFTPPDNLRVPDYVMVFPMTIHVDYSTPLDRGRNAPLGRDIARWNSIARNVLVWDHIANFSGFYQPTPNIYPIGHSIRWLATLPNVTGYFAEGSWNTPDAEFASLRAWLIARLLWDPAQDVEALVAEFADGYYGAAAPDILRYLDLMHAAIVDADDVLAEKSQVDLAMYSLDFIAAADALFDRAEARVAASPAHLAHVRSARTAVDYVALVRRHEYAAESRARGLDWRVDTEPRLARLTAALAAGRARQYRQGGDIAELMQLLAIERRIAPPPARVAGLPAADWRIYQDLSLNRYGAARIVADAAASDGAAVRMKGKSSAWTIQFKLDKLPPTGRWDVYAAVRVDAPDAADGAVGLRVGSAPPMSRSDPVRVGAVNDGRYHYVKVPGGPFVRTVDHARSLYIQPPNQAAVKYLYVDGLLAIRAR